MAHPKLIKLVQRLEKQTTSGNLDWEEDPFNDGSYTVNFSDYSVAISKEIRRKGFEDSVTLYRIRLLNEKGNEVESFTDEDIDEFGTDNFILMQSIFETARRRATGAEAAIDAVLSELGDDDPWNF